MVAWCSLKYGWKTHANVESTDYELFNDDVELEIKSKFEITILQGAFTYESLYQEKFLA